MNKMSNLLVEMFNIRNSQYRIRKSAINPNKKGETAGSTVSMGSNSNASTQNSIHEVSSPVKEEAFQVPKGAILPLAQAQGQVPESKWHKIMGLNEMWDKNIWKCLLAEYLGTFIMIFLGTGSVISSTWGNKEPSIVHISLAFGFGVTSVISAIGHISGAHLNPSVSIGLTIAGNMGILKCLIYIVVQCLAGISASAILEIVTPEIFQGDLGSTNVDRNISPSQGFLVEVILTFILVLNICGVYDQLKSEYKGTAPLFVGFTVSACLLAFIPFTGSSINPCRSFGPSVIINSWENHWVYWIGPILGASVAGFIYRVAFKPVKQD